MEIKQVSEFSRSTVIQLLASIPFYKAVRQQDLWQFELLMQHSQVVSFEPGETVLKFGERDSWLYFLLKGQLAVYVGSFANRRVINYITAGEVFGDLAMLMDDYRTATLVAQTQTKHIMAFGTDFTIFGEIDDFRMISLQTKLAYYGNTVHNLRWKLEQYRVKYPSSELAAKHRQLKLYSGSRGSYDELCSLHQQARDLARLLVRWNQEFGALPLNDVDSLNASLAASMD